MYITTDEAMEILKQESVIKNRQTLLRFIREGKIEAYKKSNKDGYRIERESLKKFVEENKERGTNSIFERMEKLEKEVAQLQKENEKLRFKLKTPETILQAENLKLVEKIEDLEEENERLKQKIKEKRGKERIY